MQHRDFMDRDRAELTSRAQASRAVYIRARQIGQSYLAVLYAGEAHESSYVKPNR